MECPVCKSTNLVTDIEGIHCIKCGFNIRTNEEDIKNSKPISNEEKEGE